MYAHAQTYIHKYKHTCIHAYSPTYIVVTRLPMSPKSYGMQRRLPALSSCVLLAALLPAASYVHPWAPCLRVGVPQPVGAQKHMHSSTLRARCGALPEAVRLGRMVRSIGLRVAASSTAATVPNADVDAFARLSVWLQESGGQVHGAVQMTSDDLGAGRGLLVVHAVGKGERLVVVPARAQLINDSGDENPALRDLVKTLNPNVRGMHLGLKLLQEKVKSNSGSSFNFDPYIKSLPPSFDGLPTYYVDNIPELQFSNVERQAVARITELLRITQACLSLADTPHDPFNGTAIGVNELLWASAAASSRALRLPGRGGQLEALVPVVDFVNHAFDANCCLQEAFEEADPGAVVLTAARDISAG